MSLLIFQRLAEQRIQKAIQKGEFENLPGKGKPLELEDLSHVPEELRLAYKVLKNAGFLPPEAELLKEIRTVEDLLEHMEDEEHKLKQIKKLNYLILKLNQVRHRPINLEKEQRYYEKIVQKVEVFSSKKSKAKTLEKLEEGQVPKIDYKRIEQQTILFTLSRLARRKF
ncbi:DnaJ family domain-containing protein [Thermodesulfatator autotrophicus]|uniref:DnaJ family domain-containing protein n=1 Tax=Thermodesulfatator autotrophicus TaxID=1795632 RepID=UPI000838CE42|nr:DnaJ family domain-containing protein [Thermodesulfatator autotrophicus]